MWKFLVIRIIVFFIASRVENIVMYVNVQIIRINNTILWIQVSILFVEMVSFWQWQWHWERRPSVSPGSGGSKKRTREEEDEEDGIAANKWEVCWQSLQLLTVAVTPYLQSDILLLSFKIFRYIS